MHMLWFFLALISTFFYAVSNIFDKIVREHFIKDTIVILMLGELFSFIAFIAIVFFKGLTWIGWSNFILANFLVALYFFSLFPYYKAIAIKDASIVVSLFNLQPLFVLILSFIFLHEQLSNYQYLGFIFIIFGSLLINWESKKRKLYAGEAFWLTLICTFIWAIYLLFLKKIYLAGDFWLISSYLYGISALYLIPLIIFSPTRKKFFFHIKKQPLVAFLFKYSSSLVNLVAELFNRWALILGSVSLIAVIGGTQGAFVLITTVFLGKFIPQYIKEKNNYQLFLQKLVAILFMIIGLYLINFSSNGKK